jgi:DNA-binding response OmpR family regulator
VRHGWLDRQGNGAGGGGWVLIAWALRDVLERNGYAVVGPVATQSAALDLMEREHPQMAVVDVRLKEGDGISTGQDMRRSRIGVLFLTGRGAKLVADSGLRTGVVEEPFRPESIAGALKAVRHFNETGKVPNWAPREPTTVGRHRDSYIAGSG